MTLLGARGPQRDPAVAEGRRRRHPGGLPFALAVACCWRAALPGRGLLDALTLLPLVLPPVATGYVLLLLFGPPGLARPALASVGDRLRLPLDRRGAGGRVMAFPLMVRPIRLAIEAIDREVARRPAPWAPGRWRGFLASPCRWPRRA